MLTLHTHAVNAVDMGARDGLAVESVEVRQQHGGSMRALARHDGSSVTVWDFKTRARIIRHTKEDIMLIPQLRQAWSITSCCWASREADAFMTGHESGIVCHWRLVDSTVQFCNVYEVRLSQPVASLRMECQVFSALAPPVSLHLLQRTNSSFKFKCRVYQLRAASL